VMDSELVSGGFYVTRLLRRPDGLAKRAAPATSRETGPSAALGPCCRCRSQTARALLKVDVVNQERSRCAPPVGQ
jgi:hypothetical protein